MIAKSSAWDSDPLDPQHFSFLDLDSDPQKNGNPRIQIQRMKYQPKHAKNKSQLSTNEGKTSQFL